MKNKIAYSPIETTKDGSENRKIALRISVFLIGIGIFLCFIGGYFDPILGTPEGDIEKDKSAIFEDMVLMGDILVVLGAVLASSTDSKIKAPKIV